MAKIKLYRGIGADTKEELEKYIKEFYDMGIKAHGYGGGGNLGDGIYFTSDKNEAIAYSKHNDYKDWKYGYVFEVEVDTKDFLSTDKIDYSKMLELDDEYKRLDNLMRTGRGEDIYNDFIKAQDRALEKYVVSQNKKGIMDGKVFNVQTKKGVINTDNTTVNNQPKSIPKMSKTSNYWDKRALRRLSEAEKYSETYIKRVKAIYNQAYKDVERELASVYKNYAKDTGLDTQRLKELLTRSETKELWEQMKKQGLDKYIKNNYKSRISRLEKIQAQIYAKAKAIYPQEELQNTMCYKGVINQSYYKTMYDTQMGTGYDFSFSRLDNNMVNALLTERWSGKNYSERIWGNTDILANTLSEMIGGALLSGQSTQLTAKQIRDRFNVSKYYAERLIRTETNHFNNEVDAMAYEELGVKKYVFVATLDSRTSEICQSMDNKVFDYKDRQDGVNYPPLHPNCRSKTRAYLGEEAEKDLKRRARDPKTGKTELIDNISYKEWIKRYTETPTNVEKPPVTNTKPVNDVEKPVKNWVKPTNLPAWFKDYKGNVDEEGILLAEWLNKNGNPNSKASKVFSKSVKDMGLARKDGEKNTFMFYKEGKGQFKPNGYHYELIAPKLTDKADPTGSIQVMLHENWHAIDRYNAIKNGTSSKYLSNSSTKLKDVVFNDNNKIGADVTKLFEEYNKECRDIATKVSNDNNYLFEEINKKYDNGTIKSYSSYRSAWTKARNKIKNIIEYEERNAMGGGVDMLQDIYDSLSGGYYREKGIVKFGHGRKYFSKYGMDSQLREILANYGAISMTRPDLVKLLKADKPALVRELDAVMDMML